MTSRVRDCESANAHYFHRASGSEGRNRRAKGSGLLGVSRANAVINRRALAYTRKRKEPWMHAAHQKAYKGAGMEGWVARWYTRTRQNDMADFRREAKAVADRLASGASVLEVAPGPGFFAIELVKLQNYRITGLDISRTLVRIATDNARRAGVKIDFCLGDASAMSFPDECFDSVYCSAAFKNFAEPIKALDEMHRVLRPRV
ncbi:MAG: hypothetical protein DMG41_18430 [Acidobacteria bacterium]|nr:MAG: hypothetical protein DMG42_33450 [Acidobacteriota bacterium]PYT86684.1 MAG: hypothetical protein DMG41_18430 [Acidobacteriota bacterium]